MRVLVDVDGVCANIIEGLNIDDIKVVKADANLNLVLRPANNTAYLAFNFHVKEFQNKQVREAIAHAINRKAILEAIAQFLG